MLSTSAKLRTIKMVHTLAWAFFVACIVLLPIAGLRGRLTAAACLAGCVAGEVAVLASNHWRCPLTDVAARYTTDRRPNFDIYLPEWLARHNKGIFGTFFVVGLVVTLARWRRWL